MARLTTAELKIINQKKIFHIIYQEKKIAKQDIAEKLKMSLPTISQNLKELEEMNLIEKKGSFESTGGRKAYAICLVSNAKVSIGVEVSKKLIRIVALDLCGTNLKELTESITYVNNDAYYQTLGNLIFEVISSLHLSSERILGVRIALQGLISADGNTVAYGKILGCTGISIDNFTKYIPYPCSMVHDAEAAAIAELWFSHKIEDAIYFSISNNLSGAIIIDGKLHKGHELKSGMIEHMTIVPDGNPCYCGKKGCLEAYCSINSLLPMQETLESFFKKLNSCNKEYINRWESFLRHLALAIDNIHMVIDCDIILGGELAAYLTKEDIKKLQALVEKDTAFAIERTFIKTSLCNTFAIAQGAALYYIKRFLSTVIDS
jgi:N-acetylglucosamine repressor